MRITNSITTNNALWTLQRGSEQVARAERRVTTGLRLSKASDDPSAAGEVMGARSGLRALTQYQRNVDSASSRASAEEGVLDQLGTILIRARELAVSQATATATTESRRVVKAEVDQLFRFAVSLGNTQFAGDHIFGGERLDVAPFAVVEGPPLDFTSTMPTGSAQTEISSGQWLTATHDGTEVFGTPAGGVLASLAALSAALGADDQDAIGATLADLRASNNHVDDLTGAIGARVNQLDITKANLVALTGTLNTYRSSVEEVDFEEAVTELVSRQTAFQAAMLATSKVMGMNLTDYLR
ncbi:MAG TPA: flagellar hook-associated protein FlgL [Gemmatimonadaceae bacterium]|jgi:flagellar hook-associated protein 3 FlgL|nr:flagellar hook-associated protein FlgL [Gemmatimonadaceae bacterium]